MELYKIVELIKKEYDTAVHMQKKTTDKAYWFGRYTITGELLNKLQRERNKPYKSCALCTLTSEGCRECFEK